MSTLIKKAARADISSERRANKQPSSKHPMSKAKNKTTRSPGCPSRSSSAKLPSNAQRNQDLLKKHDRHFSSTGGQSVAAESRQSPDRGSRLGSKTPDMEEAEQPVRSEASKDSSGVQEDSVLAKYIERFRHGLPQSRTQRQLGTSVSGEEQELLWWKFHSSSPFITQTKTLQIDDHDSPVSNQHLYDGSITLFSDTSQGDLEDSNVLQLQDRAGRLILENEDDLNTGSVHVSSDGLGFSSFSSPASVDEPVRQPLTRSLMKPARTNSDSIHAFQKSFLPTLTPPTRPEEDILFQWRLRRKLEQARESSSLHGSTLSWQPPRLSHPPASELMSKQQTATSQSAEGSHSDDHPNVIALQPEAHRQIPPALPAYVVSSSSLPQSLGSHLTSSPHTSPGAVEGEELSHPKIPEKDKNAQTKEPEKTGATKHKRKSARERCPKKVTSPKEQLQRERSHESCPADYEPPPSPVHIALGQAVSEVLFPVSPDPTVTTAKKIPISPCEAQNSLEVISQLLQEAEDSDEKEFENDPLLQVLRQQRKWVKAQIRDVDSMLSEFPEGQEVI
ncbi:hypothetical protein OJAV_G00157840 [Oryzias javanicus]|uniref:Proline and serine-rich protein 3 n=1 Tax=Oryzias javanicus TaxID=123683 RepID=A0A437CIM0_ORYJA|nr:hypothetical protein OJAV_G00157840 [Oryzias javanicus]